MSPGFTAALSMFGGAFAVGVADISQGDAYAIGDSGPASSFNPLVLQNG